MKLSEFDYKYPEELIAKYPLKDRDASRMLVLNREHKKIIHDSIKDLPRFFKKGDLLVINDTQVFPARLIGQKESSGKVELLLLKTEEGGLWRVITNQTARIKIGLKIKFDLGLVGEIISRDGDELLVKFNRPELIEGAGLPPLPPYILAARRHYDSSTENDLTSSHNDKERYQTVYAKNTGSAAAPTAGLHFTKGLLEKIRSVGVDIVPVTLHVGLDTFSPVRVDDIENYKMHGEEYFVAKESAEKIAKAKEEGRRVIAVGTTSVRVLESFMCNSEHKGTTNLFITPGYKFNVVDAMLTNFHQPKSTLLMLVSAFAGKDLIMKIYEEVIANEYRLFSYGDCMLIL